MNPATSIPLEPNVLNQMLPAFDFSSMVASGPAGAVYVATQKSLDRNVAIKILSPEISGNPQFRETFENTARTMAKFNHPNLIGVYDSGVVDGRLYFVMEFIPGKSLKHSAQGHCVEVSQAMGLIEGICAGLSFAHKHGVVHGGVTPSIILLNQKAEPKIGSFGLVPSADAERSPYVAPEAVGGGVAADIYAAGAILYELLTGNAHQDGAPVPSSVAACPPQIDEIWKKATAVDPAVRYAGMDEFHQDVAGFLHFGAIPSAAVVSGRPSAAGPARMSPGNGASGPPAAKPKAVRTGGMNWGLIRNLIINAALAYAVYLAWGFYLEKKERVEKINRENAARYEEMRNRSARETRERLLPSNNSHSAPPALPKPERVQPGVVDVETQEASLQRLRERLFRGARDEMPKGSIAQGESHYLLVSTPMSWPEAADFAENHGAHLAVPAVGADLPWMVANVTRNQDAWIGVARSGTNSWTLADGRSWKPNREPSGVGTYVGVDKGGFLRASTVNVRLPFVIQWHRDGKNPGALENMLVATRASISKSAAVYPPGCRAFDGHLYLYVARPVAWNEAKRLAGLGGATLAIPATAAESAFVSDLAEGIQAPNGIWLGGVLNGKQWSWVNGEPWKFAKWGKGAVNDLTDSALVLHPGKDWASLKMDGEASGFLLEWGGGSKPSASGAATAAPANEGAYLDVDALTAKAKELIVPIDAKRRQQLDGNAKKLSADLDAHLRSLPGSAQETWRSEIEKIKAGITGGRIPEMIPASSGIKVNTVMMNLFQYAVKKQQQYDDEFIGAVSKLHAAYLKKITDSIAQASQSGQPLVVQALQRSYGESKNLDDWLAAMGLEARPANPDYKPRNHGSKPDAGAPAAPKTKPEGELVE